VRAGLAPYNTVEEIEGLIESVERFAKGGNDPLRLDRPTRAGNSVERLADQLLLYYVLVT
jgi:hypothetical protein